MRRHAAPAPGTEPDAYMVDTSCWLEWYRGTPVGSRIQRFLDGKRRYTPSSVIGELRTLHGESFFKIKSVVINNSSTVNCDDRISERAGLLKREGGPRRMGWVDYVVLASAIARHAGVCSTDHHFGSFRRIVRVKLFAKP